MYIEYTLADHHREIVAPLINACLPVLPVWATVLVVRYNPTIDAIAKVTAQSEYRTIVVQLGDQWFSEPRQEQRVHLLHEFAHAHYAPTEKVFRALLEAYTDNDSPARKWADEAMRLAEEGAVSDLSRVFEELTKGAS